jgi:hypothetical protein
VRGFTFESIPKQLNFQRQNNNAMSTPEIIKTICLFCGVVIKEGPPHPVSHGACKRCAEIELAKLDEKEEEGS